MTARVLVERLGAVARVTLNRPDKLNALDLEMFAALPEAAADIAADADINAVVLCGAGRAFCAGLDLSAFEKGPELASSLLEPAGDGPGHLGDELPELLGGTARREPGGARFGEHDELGAGGLDAAAGGHVSRWCIVDTTILRPSSQDWPRNSPGSRRRHRQTRTRCPSIH